MMMRCATYSPKMFIIKDNSGKNTGDKVNAHQLEE